MRFRLSWITAALCGSTLFSAVPLLAQSTNESHWIGRLGADQEKSDAYLARTPYVLKWDVDKTYKLYGNAAPLVKADSYLAGIHVIDVATGKMIQSTGRCGLSGEMRVSVAGRHRLHVFSTAPVKLSFMEDKTMLEAAARRGELKDGMTIETSKAGSVRTKNEKVDALKAEIINALESKRSSIGNDAVDALRLDAERAAQLATSEQDLNDRFRVLSNATVARIKASRETGAGNESRPADTGSTWTGKGLPPGMMKR